MCNVVKSSGFGACTRRGARTASVTIGDRHVGQRSMGLVACEHESPVVSADGDESVALCAGTEHVQWSNEKSGGRLLQSLKASIDLD